MTRMATRSIPLPERIWRVLGWAALLIGVLFAAAYLVLYITKGRFLRHTFERYASSYAHREVRVAGDFQLYLDPRIRFVADGLTVANPDWAKSKQLVNAKHIDLELKVLPLLGGHRRMPYLVLDGADLGLERDKDGRDTWTLNPDDKTPIKIPEIARASVTNTHVDYRDAVLQLILGLGVNGITATQDKVQSAILLAGKGTSRGVPLTLTGRIDNPNAAINGNATKMAVTLHTGGSQLDVSGTLPGPTIINGADLTVHAKGKAIGDIFALIGAAMPATRSYDLHSHLTKEGDEYRFTRLTGTFGDSDLAGTLTAVYDKRLKLEGDLHSKTVDILDVGPWFGYDPNALDAKGTKGFIMQEGGHPRLIPDEPLAYDAIGRLDAEVKYHADRLHFGHAPIVNFVTDVSLEQRLLKLEPLSFDLAGGRLIVNATLNARQRPVVTEYDIRQTTVKIERLLQAVGAKGLGTTGTIGGRIHLKGTGDSLRRSLASSNGRIAIVLPQGTLQLGNDELVGLDAQNYLATLISSRLKHPIEVNCGLIAFTVRGGRATADPVLIDTQRSVIKGTGGFAFPDESMDLAIKADSKRISLFSGQSPVNVGGYFAAPRINPISKQLLTRAGVSVALGLATGGPGAILAFIDPGDAKAQACGPILTAKPAAKQVQTRGRHKFLGIF